MLEPVHSSCQHGVLFHIYIFIYIPDDKNCVTIGA